MHILLVITDYGSFNNFLSELAIKLVNNGDKVDVICSPEKIINLQDKHAYTSLGINFHYVNLPRGLNPLKVIKASRQISKLIAKINPSIINVHFTTGIFTTLLWRKPKQKIIGTLHGVGYIMAESRSKRMIFSFIEKFCFNRLDNIYVLNQFDYNIVKQLHPTKTFVYQSFGVGFDDRKFNPLSVQEEEKDILRGKLGIEKDDFVLAFTGRFVDFKGFNILVRAVNRLIESGLYPNLKLMLIGGKDPARDTGLLPDEESHYQSNPQFIKVDFTADVEKYLSLADLFVFPSAREGMPVCIMEALAMGIPVLTSDSRGCNDLVESDFNGVLLSEKPNVEETVTAIEKLFCNRILLRKLSENALSRRDEYSRQQFVLEQIKAYQPHEFNDLSA
jgi:glycosyltransferase involved in cell wall biosynthesis